MHTIRYQGIIHRRNAAGEWQQTIECEYYMNEPEDGEVLYRIKGDKKEPVVFRHSSKDRNANTEAGIFRGQVVKTDKGTRYFTYLDDGSIDEFCRERVD